MAHASFDWSDPLALDAQLSADERAIRDAAYARACSTPFATRPGGHLLSGAKTWISNSPIALDYNVKVCVKADGSGVDRANAEMSANPFDEIAVEEAVRLREKGVTTEVIAVACDAGQCHETPRTEAPAHLRGR